MQPARRQRRDAAAFDDPDRARVLLEHVPGKMLHIFIVGTMHHVHGVVCAGTQAATRVRSSQEQHQAKTPKHKTLNPCITKPPEPAWRVELRVQSCAVAAARPRHSWGGCIEPANNASWPENCAARNAAAGAMGGQGACYLRSGRQPRGRCRRGV
jgi:hypothetical protein